MIKDCSSIQQSDIPKNIATMIIQIFKLFMMKINKTTLNCPYCDNMFKESHISIYLIFDKNDVNSLYSDVHYSKL